MTRFSRILGYVTVAAFLLAGVVSGHVGHSAEAASHSSGDATEIGQSSGTSPQAHGTGDEEHGDKDACEHEHLSICSSGHCCFPVLSMVLTQSEGDETYAAFKLAAPKIDDQRLDPPPPKLQ